MTGKQRCAFCTNQVECRFKVRESRSEKCGRCFRFRHRAILSLPKLVWREQRRAEGGRLRLGALCRGRARLSAMQLSQGSECQNHRTVNCDPCTRSSINKGRYNCQNKQGRLSAGRQSKLKIQTFLNIFCMC